MKIVVMARQEARGKRQEVFSDFTFLYTVWFYCVHLLRDFQLKKYPKISCGAGILPANHQGRAGCPS
ncbi:hypothetical protein QHH03_26405, partial [Aphanizomenon sp. 202]|nr:hypothetical protein [Aphanizomenon sp. 202]